MEYTGGGGTEAVAEEDIPTATISARRTGIFYILILLWTINIIGIIIGSKFFTSTGTHTTGTGRVRRVPYILPSTCVVWYLVTWYWY